MSLLLIGAYFLAMIAVSDWLSYAGGDFARWLQFSFLIVASAIALSEAFKLSSATFYLSPPGTILAFNIGGLFSWCMT